MIPADIHSFNIDLLDGIHERASEPVAGFEEPRRHSSLSWRRKLAKTRKAAGDGEHPNGGKQDGAPAPDVMRDFAADLGKFLGGVQNRATSWLQQRKDIADQLTRIRDTANQYLQQLGAEGSHLVERFEKARRGRPPGSKNTKPRAETGSPLPEAAVAQAPAKKRFMSAEARARIADAQRKRWAKLRRGTRGANR